MGDLRNAGWKGLLVFMSEKKVAQSLIKKFQVDEGVLNMIEMASRAYAPCLGCVIPIRCLVRCPER